MKRVFLILACVTMGLASCEQNELLEHNSSVATTKTTINENVLGFDSKETLASVINDGTKLTRASISKFKVGTEFVSMMDEVSPSSELWKELTEDERKCITENHMTYYEALGYEDLVPNENFAKLLNNKGEIVVDDSLYRITPIGTFCSDTLHYKDIDECYCEMLNSEDTVPVAKNHSIKISPTVTFYNSFADAHQEDVTAPSSRAGSCIPLMYCDYKSSGVISKWLRKIIGDRSTKEFEYISKRRINASLYDYNYGVYYESGALVYATRKRGGFFRKINGWKDIDAEELEITCKNVWFELDFNLPKIAPQMPKNPVMISNDNRVYTNMSNKPLKTLDIWGWEVDYKMIANAIKFGFKYLSNKLGKNVAPDTKVVRILTPSKMYICILDCTTSSSNCHQIRKVFNSGCNFYISSNIINNPISVSAARDLFRGLYSIPVQRIESGRVIFTSKIEGNWGGIVIDKEINSPHDECIVK